MAEPERDPSSAQAGGKAVPPPPMPHDKRGWRVAPAPDGRGTPDEHRPRPPHRWLAYPVRKVSIIPRGQALGVTLSTPDTDRVSYSREELDAKIKVSLGGRVAEEIVFGKITTGAESDIEQLTQIAREMVGRWGMSDKLGPVTLLPRDGQGPLLPGASETSPQMQWLVDDEVRHIVDDAHEEVTRLLSDHRNQLESLAQTLIKAETLDAPDAYAAAGVPMHAAELQPQPS